MRKAAESKTKYQESLIKDYESMISNLRKDLDDAKSEVFKLEQELKLKNMKLLDFNNLTKENQELKAKINLLTLEIKNIKEISLIIEESAQKDLKIKDLELTHKENYEKLRLALAENKELKSISDEYEVFREKYDEMNGVQELARKNTEKEFKNQIKKKYKIKEEKLKNEINDYIEEIQKTIKLNNSEFIKSKKENAKLLESMKIIEESLKAKEETLKDYKKTIEHNENIIQFLTEKIGKTENSLKLEMEKCKTIEKQIEQEKISQKNVSGSLNKKIAEKSVQLSLISDQLTELERKNSQISSDSSKKDQKIQELLNEKTKLKHIIEENEKKLVENQKDQRNLEEKYEERGKELEKNIFERKSLEKNLSDLEISLKYLDIQHTRKGLEELNVLRIKLNEENEQIQKFE